VKLTVLITPIGSSYKFALPIHQDTCLFLVNGNWNQSLLCIEL